MAGQPIKTAKAQLAKVISEGNRDVRWVYGVRARSLLPGDLELGLRGRAVLLELACDVDIDPRVRLCASVELVKLGLAEEERARLRDAAETGSLAGMSDDELQQMASSSADAEEGEEEEP